MMNLIAAFLAGNITGLSFAMAVREYYNRKYPPYTDHTEGTHYD